MKNKDILTIVAVALMAGSCSSKEELQSLKEPVPIRLTTSVGMEAVTRGADGKVIETDAVITRGIQENAIASGEKVYVWANEAGGSSWDYLKAWTLTADGSTGLSGSTKYYPPDGTTITMNAVHGNFSTEPSEDNTAIGTLTHSVVADQSAAGNYEKSDLLFGTATGSKASTSAENIDFTHMLSKIEVNLTAGYGYDATDLETAEVHLNNVLPTVTIDPTDGTLGSASGTAVTITPRKDATTGTYEAVIPSQTFANPDALISVTTNNLTLTPPATLTSTVPNTIATFNENTKYIYNVTVDKQVPPKTTIAYATTSQLAVGDIVCDDGSIYSPTAEATAYLAAVHKNPVGIIAFVNDGTSIGDAATEKGKGRYETKSQGRALVLCAMNVGGTANNATIGTLLNYGSPLKATLVISSEAPKALASADYYWGYTNTSDFNNSSHPALQAAYNFNTLQAPAGSTGWFLPSIGQWKKILIHAAGFSDTSGNKPLVGTWYDNTFSTCGTNLNNKLNVLAAAGCPIVNTISTNEAHAYMSSSDGDTGHNSVNNWDPVSHKGVLLNNRCGPNSLGLVRPVFAF